jgi:hypothetical protein
MTPQDFPPAKPYSKKLADHIVAITARRDNEIIDIFQTCPDSPARHEEIQAIKKRWREAVLAGCIETFEHAESLIETMKALHASIQEVQSGIASRYPEELK